ncbi:MAG: zf-HC2 domain-containing protein [Acidobacteriaceae bacterium]|nr:zf-HC2 domain-containing protein [Acidobacteriaceae bacterium]
MNTPDHLTNDLLIRALDDELTPEEAEVVDPHLRVCEACKGRSAEFRFLSGKIESLVATAAGPAAAQRQALAHKLETQARSSLARRSSRLALGFGWTMALAASLALMAVLLPRWIHPVKPAGNTVAQVQSGMFEVDGENFILLPYSNPDLSTAAPHIVQMQVPVGSLAAAGITFEPVSNGAQGMDRSVLADVLFGMDGQPLGVHVVSLD